MIGNCTQIAESNAYQGEPFGATLFVKIDDEYRESLADYILEAMLYNDLGRVVCTWSSAEGSIEIKTVTVDEQTRGCAAFGVDGKETADWQIGDYTLELAQVISKGRKIGKAECLIHLLPARIRKGV